MPEASYFTDDSMLRQVHREYVVALSGPRALLMQATHQKAFRGFFAHTSALDEPYERLSRTALVMDTIAFGSKEQADRMTRRVRAMHRRVQWETDDGEQFRADDPGLLMWILATLVDSALLVFQRYVRPLSRDERDAYWQDYKQIGRLFALTDQQMPDSIEDFEAYMAEMLDGDELGLSDEARELAIDIVLRPPVPLWARPLLETANQITVGLLPPRIRGLYGFWWDPAREVAVRAGAQYARRLVLPFLPGFVRHVPSARAVA